MKVKPKVEPKAKVKDEGSSSEDEVDPDDTAVLWRAKRML